MRKTNLTAIYSLICLLFLAVSSLASPAPAGSANPSYRESLQALEKTVPLTYNRFVQRQIDAYLTSSQKGRFGRMLGLAEYYFPIYEKVFHERGLPEEIKYLSVVESALNPNAMSSYGAGGLWQFLWQYGKIYGLTINDSIDERRDPALSANAAASYLLDSYAMYNDWLLAIASYNSGRNNIKWAMEKADSAGLQIDYWSIRQFLPKESQQYVPAYIATVYVMNNYRKHGIRPVMPGFPIRTETISVNKPVSLAAVAQATESNPEDLFLLNAAYLNGTVNGSPEAPKNLIVPVLPDYSYNALCTLLGIPNTRIAKAAPVKPAPPRARYYISYRVQPGDTPTSIAEKFKGVTAEEIKAANRLSGDTLNPMSMLKIPQYK